MVTAKNEQTAKTDISEIKMEKFDTPKEALSRIAVELENWSKNDLEWLYDEILIYSGKKPDISELEESAN